MRSRYPRFAPDISSFWILKRKFRTASKDGRRLLGYFNIIALTSLSSCHLIKQLKQLRANGTNMNKLEYLTKPLSRYGIFHHSLIIVVRTMGTPGGKRSRLLVGWPESSFVNSYRKKHEIFVSQH